MFTRALCTSGENMSDEETFAKCSANAFATARRSVIYVSREKSCGKVLWEIRLEANARICPHTSPSGVNRLHLAAYSCHAAFFSLNARLSITGFFATLRAATLVSVFGT